MGEIIVRKVRGMNLKAKIALVLMFTMVFSMFMYQGWYRPKASEATGTTNGMFVFSNNTTTPQNSGYTASTNTFAAGAATVAGAVPSFMVNRSATTRTENIVGYVTTGGVLYIERYNGATWSNEWNVTVGGNGVNGRRFDIAYEKSSGRAMVVYSTNTTTASGTKLAYRIWDGATWSAATNITTARSTTVSAMAHIKLASRPGSNEIAVAAQDNGTTTGNNSILTSLIWNGTAWGNEPATAHDTAMSSSTTQLIQYDNFDLAYESLSGGLVVVWSRQAASYNGYRTYSGGTWSAVTAMPGTARAALQTYAVANPRTDQIMAIVVRSATANIYGYIFDGTAWGTQTSLGITMTATGTNKHWATGQWLNVGGTDYAVAIAQTATTGTIGYNYYTGAAWGTQATLTGVGATNALSWVDSDADPFLPDTLMLTGSYLGATNTVLARRLVLTAGPVFTWSTPAGSPMGSALTNVTSQNFSFAYNELPPPTLTIGGGTNPPNHGAARSDTNQTINAFTMQMNLSNTGTVSSLTITGDTNFTSTNIPTNGVKVWRDTGTVPGQWDAGDTLISTASTAIAANATTVTISPSQSVTNVSQNFIVTVDIAAAATIGNTFTATVSGAVGTGIGTPVDSDTTGAIITVVTPALAVGDGTNPNNANAQQNSTNNALNSFTLGMNGGTGTVTSLVVTGVGNFTAANIPTNGVKVWRDSGTTIGKMDAADTLISTGSTAIAGNVTTVTITSEAVTNTAKNYLVTVDINAGATLTQTFTGTVTAVSGTGLGTPTYGDSSSATLTINKLASSNTSCASCHGYTTSFTDGFTRNSPEGTFVGDHNAHVIKASVTCSVCHVAPATTTSADFNHRNGNIEMQATISSGTYSKGASFAQTNTPTTGTCSNVSCHGGAGTITPQWGIGTASCVDCHAFAVSSPIAQGLGGPATRSAVVGEFGLAWGHKKSGRGAVTASDCIVCHLEGNFSTQKTSTYHRDGYIDLRDPDGVGEVPIKDVQATPANYRFLQFATSYLAGSRTSTGHTLNNTDNILTQKFCLACHDANGATNTTARTTYGAPTQYMPFGGVNLGANYTVANGAAAVGGLVNVKTELTLTNSSVHPVLGPINRDFPIATRLLAPYNGQVAGRVAAGGTKTLSVVLNCFDCHNTPTTPLTTRTVAAHGNAVTLRGNIYVSPTTLCQLCHTGYTTSGSHGSGSAENTNLDGGENMGTSCYNCHGSTGNDVQPVTVSTVRPVRAQDYHGYNSLVGGGLWPTINSKPYGFIRNNTSFVYHRPLRGIGELTTGSASCSGSGTQCANNNSAGPATYTPGGQY